jgi:hypothetical protein
VSLLAFSRDRRLCDDQGRERYRFRWEGARRGCFPLHSKAAPLQIDEARVAAEQQAMRDYVVTTTSNRRVLGRPPSRGGAWRTCGRVGLDK